MPPLSSIQSVTRCACLLLLALVCFPAPRPAEAGRTYAAVAPMAAPDQPLPTMNGLFDRDEYARAWSAARILYRPHWQFPELARVRILSTRSDLYIHLEGIPIGLGGQERSVSLAFDILQDGGWLPNSDDIRFVITETGQTSVQRGAGFVGWVDEPAITGWQAVTAPHGEFHWNCEVRIPLRHLRPPGGSHGRHFHIVGFHIRHHSVRSPGDDFGWPPDAGPISPSTWGNLILFGPRTGNQVFVDTFRITQGYEYDATSRVAYDFVAGKETLVRATLYAPMSGSSQHVQVAVQRVSPSPGPVHRIDSARPVSRFPNAPTGRHDTASAIDFWCPGHIFDVPGVYSFEILSYTLSGSPRPPVRLGTREYKETKDFNVLLLPVNLTGVVDDGRAWGEDLTANVAVAMDEMARLFPVRDGAAPFVLAAGGTPPQAGIRYLFIPRVVQPRQGDTLDTLDRRARQIANSQLHLFNRVLEMSDPANNLGRIDRAMILGASTDTGGGQAQSSWSPCSSGSGFDAFPWGASASVVIHEFYHCLGHVVRGSANSDGGDHSRNRFIPTPGGRNVIDFIRRTHIAQPRSLMFWQVGGIRETFVEGAEWNAVREYLVNRPRLPGCTTCGPAKDGDFLPVQNHTGRMFRFAGSMNVQDIFSYSTSEIKPAEGLVPTAANPSGSYTLEMIAGDGSVLTAFPFDIQFGLIDDGDMVDCCSDHQRNPQFLSEAGFALQVPLADGSVRVRITARGNTLWEMTLPETTPDILSLDMTDDGKGNMELTWTASDPGLPQNQLRHSVLFRRSAGAPAVLLADGLTDSTIMFPTHMAPASGDARLIVRTSNGANTVEVESDPFEISPTWPAVSIVRPAPEDLQDLRTMVIQGQPYLFRGAAFDYTEGVLGGESLVWTSNVDGVLGTGSEIWATLPTAGGHVITLTATNSSQLSEIANLQLFVLADSDGDGIPDDYENQWDCLDANVFDSHLDPDMDGLTSLEEFFLGTNPCDPDTDGNGYTDGDEVSMGSDPLDPQSIPQWDGLFLPAFPPPTTVTAGLPCPPVARTIPILTVLPQTEWTVSSDSPWLVPVTEKGIGDGQIELFFDCDLMIPGWNRGTIMVATEDHPARVVTIEVDFLPDGLEGWAVQ